MRFDYLELFFSAVAGGGVGFLSGVFGVGGAFLLVPILNVGLGLALVVVLGNMAMPVAVLVGLVEP